MLGRLSRRLHGVRAGLAARRDAAHTRRRIADFARTASPDQVVDFLFTDDARAIQPWQIPAEFRALARLVAERRPRVVLEIGTADGGTLFAHARCAHEQALLISIDLPAGPFGGGYPAWRIPLYRSFAGPAQQLELLRLDSHAPGTITVLERILAGRRVDYAFIDGDHTCDGVRQDLELCRRFAARDAIIAFHDIAAQPNPEWLAAAATAPGDGAVHEFWGRVKRDYAHEEYVDDPAQEGYGIGVLYLDRPRAAGDAP